MVSEGRGDARVVNGRAAGKTGPLGSRAEERVAREVAGLRCCWAELGGLGRHRLGVKQGLGRAGCWAGSGGEKVLG